VHPETTQSVADRLIRSKQHDFLHCAVVPPYGAASISRAPTPRITSRQILFGFNLSNLLNHVNPEVLFL
jgi:hypothetical protein